MGLNALAAGLVALLLAAPAPTSSVRYLQSRELAEGGFAEPGGPATQGLTAWATLGLRAAGASPRDTTRRYLREAEPSTATELELVLLARSALGERPASLIARVRALERDNGAIGPSVNSTIWGVLALRQAGRPVRDVTLHYLLRRQTRSGGWSWAAGAAPDSNDTAAAIQALRALHVSGAPIRRGLVYLRRLQNRDGGFALVPGRESDTQSTAWAIQAFVAAKTPVPRGAFAYLARMRNRDGSYRYSARYVTTPVWVTSQVLPALARKPFPLR